MSSVKNQIQVYHRLIDHRNGLVLEYAELQTLTFDVPYSPAIPQQRENPSMFTFEHIFLFCLLLMLPIFIFVAYHYGKRMGKKENSPPPETEVRSPCLMLQNGISSKSTKATLSDSFEAEKERFAQLEDSGASESIEKNSPQKDTLNKDQEPFVEQLEKSALSATSSVRSRDIVDKKTDRSNEESEDAADLILLSPQKNVDNGLKLEFVMNRSSDEEETIDDVGGEIYLEKLKLHTDKSQIKKQEVKFGLSVENKDGVLQKIETKEITTIYTEGAEEPEKNALMLKSAYEKYQNNQTTRDLFIPLSHDREEQGHSRSLVPVNTPQIITANADLTRHFSFPGKKQSVLTENQINELSTDIIAPADDHLQFSKLLEKEDFPHETGKFKKIFKNVEVIGEGSFGEVYRVVHRLDGKNYAVKKVKLRLGRFDDIQKRSKVFREVFAMTDLHHENIVRYSTCWVEIENEKSAVMLEESKIKKSFIGQKGITEESESKSNSFESPSYAKSSCVGFEWDEGEGDRADNTKSISFNEDASKTKKFVRDASKKAPNSLIKSLSNTILEDEVDETSSASNLSRTELSECFGGHKLYLYIQMEYCAGQNLRNFLDTSRNNVCRRKALKMFKKILEGVDAIHKCGILHRDLKPANIFLDGNENIKIGDFGLASLDNTDEPRDENLAQKSIRGLERSHSKRIGTPMYTSPEQENGGRYNHKTDIYSMGLIFYEMLENFSTHHERYQLFNLIRRNQDISEKFKARFPVESELILKMTALNPEDRPTADDLMNQINKILEDPKSFGRIEETQSD